VSRDEEIKARLRAWDLAYQQRDVRILSEMLTDDFTLTDATGAVLTKGAYLMSVVRRPEFDVPPPLYESKDVTVRIEGDTAVVTGRSAVKGRGRGRAQTVAGDYMFTDEWVRQGGVWKARRTRATSAVKK
jgi:ketosteroid isomerase-like protein